LATGEPWFSRGEVFVTDDRFAFDALLGVGAAADVLRAVLDGVEDGIVACDASGVLRYFNRATRRMHGLPEQALPLESWAEHYGLFRADGVTPLPPEEIPLVRALREGRVEGAEMVILPRGGAPRHVVVNGRAILGHGEAVLGAVVSMHEISDRKALERTVEKVQLAQLKAVLASVSDGIIVADAKGNLVEWNAAALAMHELESLAEAQRQLGDFATTFELLSPAGEVLPVADWPMSCALRGETFSGRDVTMRHRSQGWEKQLSCAGTSVRDEQGRLILGVLTMRDVTARRRAEEQLEHNRRQLEIVVKGANVGVWYCPLPFDRLIWDATVKDHFHLAPDDEVTIDTFYARLHPDDREATRKGIEHSIAARQPYDIEYRTVSLDGKRIKWLRARGRGFYDARGEPRRFDGITIDITAHKLAEIEVRDSERRFREMADAAPAMLWITEPDGQCSFLSRGWYEYTGQTVAESLGYGWTHAAHPDDREAAGKAFRDASERRGEYEIDFRLRRADGTYRWVIDAGRPRFDASGRFLGFVGSVIDVHSRKEAEARLREGQARLRLAIEIAGLGTFDIDLQTDSVTVNDLGREIYGWGAEEPITFERVQTHFYSEDRARVLGEVTAALSPEGAGELDIEQRVVRTDGVIRWIRVRARAVFEGSGQERRAVRLVGTYLDTTERQEAVERELRHRKLVETVIHHLPASVAIVRGSDLRVELANPGYEALTAGRGAVGHQMRELWPADVSERFTATSQKVLATGEPSVAADEPLSVLGEGKASPPERFFSWSMHRVLLPGDEEPGLLTTLWETTERQALLASEKAARQRAEEEGRLKDEFLATLSHELRTPLNAILGWSTLMRRGALSERAARDGVQVIERNARAQAQLIEDLLDMSRIVSGRIRLEPGPVNLAEVVESAFETVRPAAEAKGVRVARALESRPCVVSGDPNRLQQVIWNLLHNAVKFTPRGGSVMVRLERVEEEARISVVDTGEGISADFLLHVFDRFRQADGTTTRRHGGLGLGLAIVKQLVELHGGEVGASSEGVGRGAVFVVSLPLATAERTLERGEQRAQPSRPAADRPEPGDATRYLAGISVLLVDDEPDARDLLRLVLEHSGAEVQVADSAAEALQALRRSPPNVLISDIGMPGADGYDLIRQVRELGAAEGGSTPALALTAFARAADRLRAMDAGFQAHLSKPAEPSELTRIVATLAGARGVEPSEAEAGHASLAATLGGRDRGGFA
jgi:PAS domain S-box-containing protein